MTADLRLAVISDIHGNAIALETVLAHLRPRSPDLMVNLGDCVTSPLWPRETAELLATLAIPTVRGNHDRWLLDTEAAPATHSIEFARAALTPAQLDALVALPTSLAPADDVLAVHGTPDSDTTYLLEDAIDGRLGYVTADVLRMRLGSAKESLVLCGHSHMQHVAMATGGTLVVNPGAVGAPRDADNGLPRTGEAGSPHARYAMCSRRAGRWTIEFFSLDYDWSIVARKATENGRPDFAASFSP